MEMFLGVPLLVLCATSFSIGVAELHVSNGIRVEIICTGTEVNKPTWEINGEVLNPNSAGQFLADGIESKDGWNGYKYIDTLCIDVEQKHHEYTLKCRIGSDIIYSTVLDIDNQLPPPEIVNISHTLSTVHFVLNSSFDVDVSPDENVIINVYPNITNYTVYITNLNTAEVIVHETADNSTDFMLTGLPGEDLSECTVYVFEVAANNARAGEGEKSDPQHIFIPGVTISQSTPTMIQHIADEKGNHWKVVAIAGVSMTGVLFILSALLLFCTLRTHKRTEAVHVAVDNIELNGNSAYGSAKHRALAKRSMIVMSTTNTPVNEGVPGVQ